MLNINTIEYAWETVQETISGSVLYTSPTNSIYIPETSSRTFLAADMHIFVRDSYSSNLTTAPPATFNPLNIGVWIDNNYTSQSFNHETITTAEHFSFYNVAGFASHFQTYFTGSNHNIRWEFQTPTSSNSRPFTGHTGKLLLTYQYNDTNVARALKTVRIPIGNRVGNLPITYVSMMGSRARPYNVPLLDTFLPESNKVYRDIWLQTHGRIFPLTVATVSCSIQINSGSTSSRLANSASCGSGTELFDIYKLNGILSTSTTNSIATAAQLATRYDLPFQILYVTYEYDVTSSRIFNSIICSPSTIDGHITQMRADSGNNFYYYQIPLFINERNPVLKNSSIMYVRSTSNNVNFQFSFDTNVYFPAGTAAETSDLQGLVMFNSESSVSVPAYTLITGQNNLIFGHRHNAATVMYSTPSFQAIVNYESDNTQSPLNHNRTIYEPVTQSFRHRTSGATVNNPIMPFTTNVSLESYHIQSIDRNIVYHTQFTSASPFEIIYCIDYTGSYARSGSYLFNQVLNGDSNIISYTHNHYNSVTTAYQLTHTQYKSYPEKEPYFGDNGVHFITYSTQNQGNFGSLYDYVAMNTFLYPVSCSLLNCNYPNSTYTVEFYRSGSFDRPLNILFISGSSANKSGSFNWVENVSNIYAVVSSPEYGISNMITAGSGSHIINFAQTTGGETSHTFLG